MGELKSDDYSQKLALNISRFDISSIYKHSKINRNVSF